CIISPMENLRKECKKLMVDLGLDERGSLEPIAAHLRVNRNSLNMALTGHRTGEASKTYLLQLHKYLCELMHNKFTNTNAE
ncbi:MAG: hypothetical protein JW724_03170, partial [Candidatus Altiarchaeota archaeon]|nr:hypothetical protein [Candidatus Altiarchaeota archaeon]